MRPAGLCCYRDSGAAWCAGRTTGHKTGSHLQSPQNTSPSICPCRSSTDCRQEPGRCCRQEPGCCCRQEPGRCCRTRQQHGGSRSSLNFPASREIGQPRRTFSNDRGSKIDKADHHTVCDARQRRQSSARLQPIWTDFPASKNISDHGGSLDGMANGGMADQPGTQAHGSGRWHLGSLWQLCSSAVILQACVDDVDRVYLQGNEKEGQLVPAIPNSTAADESWRVRMHHRGNKPW